MKVLKAKYNNRQIKIITVLFTVIFFVYYIFAFSLPHDFHCKEKVNSSFSSNSLDNKSNQDNSSEHNSKEEHCSNNCQICNLSYFNGLLFTEPLSNNTVLQETNERPVNNIKTGFSTFTYFKFFLRSPPSFLS